MPAICEADLRPLEDDFLIRPDDTSDNGDEPEVAGGWQRPRIGTVLAVGPGRVLDDGTVCKPSLAPGDVVALTVWGGTKFLLGDRHYIHASECDVLFVISKQKGI